MAQNEDFYLDKMSMIKLKKDLSRVFPKDSQTNSAIASGMAKAAKPLQTALKGAVKRDAKDSGRLWRSIQTFRAKRLDKFGRPSVYVGPKVKPPKKYKNKKGATKAQRATNAKAREKWISEQAGFYFYFLEYGFKPWGKGEQYLGMGWLPRIAASHGQQTLSLLYKSISDVITSSAKRKGINIS
jgi:hypothetical protein